MIKKLTLFLLLIISAHCFAQVKDSVVYEYHNSTNTWQKASLIEISYNSQCLVSSNNYYQWDTVNSQWSDVVSNTVYTYNTRGDLTEELTKVFSVSSDNLRNYSRRVYTYKNNFFEKTAVFQTWDTIQHTWISYFKRTEEYDSNGNIIKTGDESFYDGLWIPQIKKSFVYDQSNRQIATLQEQWDNYGWFGTYKTTTSYDGDYNSLQKGYTIQGNEWALFDRFIDQHTKALNQFLSNNSWIDSYKYAYEYNNNNQRIASFAKRYDMFASVWQNVVKVKDDYYADGSLKTELQQWWDVSINDWVFYLKASYTHNGCVLAKVFNANKPVDIRNKKSPVLLLLPYFNEKSKSVADKMNTENYNKYSTFTLQLSSSPKNVSLNNEAVLKIEKEKNFVIFPNPAKSFFTITTGINMNSTVLKLTDMNGKLVMQKTLGTATSQKIYLPTLPNGVYLVTLLSKENIQSAKLVIR